MQSYFYCSIEEFLGITAEETEKNGKPEELASDAQNVIKEYFEAHDFIKLEEEQRLLIRGRSEQ